MYSNIEVVRCIEWDAQQSIADSRREEVISPQHAVTYRIDLTTKRSAREGFVIQILSLSFAVTKWHIVQACTHACQSLPRPGKLAASDHRCIHSM